MIPRGFQPTSDDYVRQEMLIERLQLDLAKSRAKIVAAFVLGFLSAALLAWVY